MKEVLVGLMVMGTILFTGCGAEEEKVMKCSRTINQSSIKMNLSYNVTYKGDYVTKVESTEEVTTNDEETLEMYKTQIESATSSFKDIEYYDHEVAIKGDTLTSKITIDYEKIDTDELIEIDSSMKQLIKDGKVSVEDIESLYNQLGITCEK